MAHGNALTPRAARTDGIGAVVARRRLTRSLTRRELADAAGLAVRTIQRLERGLPASSDTILRVERALGMEEGTLVPAWRMRGPNAPEALGPRIRELRRSRGVTLVEAAEWSGRSASTLSRLERGVLGRIEPWDPRINRRLVQILGFMNEERFEDWANGDGPAPRPLEG